MFFSAFDRLKYLLNLFSVIKRISVRIILIFLTLPLLKTAEFTIELNPRPTEQVVGESPQTNGLSKHLT